MEVDTAVANPLVGLAVAPKLVCSIGVTAYNEEANIGRTLKALLEQQTPECEIAEIIVLASGCTDNTENIVQTFCDREAKVKLIVEAERQGKASAVNLFLRNAHSDILVLVGADTIPQPTTIQNLVMPFTDPEVGMVGGHPIPVNDKSKFMGFAVHLLWEMHHQVALQSPKLGELTAFRRVFHRIPQHSAVDEANMEPLITGQGYQLRYVPEAIVYNRGAETVKDFLKQRRRIHAGHLRIRNEQGYVVATMGGSHIMSAFLRAWQPDWRYTFWAPGVIALEMYGRFLGWTDYRFRKRAHTIWDIAVTTKGAIE